MFNKVDHTKKIADHALTTKFHLVQCDCLTLDVYHIDLSSTLGKK
jgi:hypothetical protein